MRVCEAPPSAEKRRAAVPAPLHGMRVSAHMLVWPIGALADGLGIRAVARVFEIDSTTVLAWLVQGADHATAFSRYSLHDLRVRQVQRDALFARFSAVQFGEVRVRLEPWAVCHLSHAVGCGHMMWRTG